MIGQPGAQQIVGLDHENEHTDNTRLTLRFHTLETLNVNTDSFLVKNYQKGDQKTKSVLVSNK